MLFTAGLQTKQNVRPALENVSEHTNQQVNNPPCSPSPLITSPIEQPTTSLLSASVPASATPRSHAVGAVPQHHDEPYEHFNDGPQLMWAAVGN